MPNIRDEVLALPPGQRAGRKAQRLAESALPHLPLSWAVGKGQERTLIQITAAGYDGPALVLQVEARRGAWSYSDDVRVVNPPVMVPTGRMFPNPDPDPDAAALAHEYEEDALKAIRAVVEDVVRLWQGMRP